MRAGFLSRGTVQCPKGGGVLALKSKWVWEIPACKQASFGESLVVPTEGYLQVLPWHAEPCSVQAEGCDTATESMSHIVVFWGPLLDFLCHHVPDDSTPHMRVNGIMHSEYSCATFVPGQSERRGAECCNGHV